MAALGPVFRKAAFAPLSAANVSLMGRLVAPGLKRLSADSLKRELDAAIADTAKAAGVRGVDVERVMPLARIDELVERVHRAQRAALDAWRNQPEADRRELDVALVTADGTVPHVHGSLTLLAEHVGLATELGRALAELAVVIHAWQEQLTSIGVVLEDASVLGPAIRTRMLRRAAVGVAVVAALATGGALWRTRALAHERVVAALAAADPCLARGIAASDLERASVEERAKAAEHGAACTRRELAAENERRTRERREAYEAHCTALVKQLTAPAKGTAIAASAHVTDAQRSLLQRIATGPLEPADYALAKPDFPCADLGHGPSFDAALSRAVLRDAGWIAAKDISEPVRASLVAGAAKLPRERLDEFAALVEREAAKALIERTPLALGRARKRCELATALGRSTSKFCGALAKN